MAKRLINVGSSVNARDGDTIRVAFIKVNDNFNEVFDEVISTASSLLQLQTSITNSGGLAVFRRYDFVDALEWIVHHNMGTRSFTESLTDSEGNRFFAKVKVVDENTFIVKLASATSGSVDVYFKSA